MSVLRYLFTSVGEEIGFTFELETLIFSSSSLQGQSSTKPLLSAPIGRFFLSIYCSIVSAVYSIWVLLKQALPIASQMIAPNMIEQAAMNNLWPNIISSTWKTSPPLFPSSSIAMVEEYAGSAKLLGSGPGTVKQRAMIPPIEVPAIWSKNWGI